MSSIKSFLNATAITLLATSVASPLALAQPPEGKGERPKFSKKIDTSIVDFAIEASGEPFVFDDDSDDFDILVAALVDTGVVAAFDGMTYYTVFAPNDGAFIALAEALTETELDEEAAGGAVLGLGREYVTQVLQYHVTEGVRNSRSVTRARQVTTLLEDENLSVEGGVVFANESDAGLVDLDNRLADGMVHVIDGVLVPFLPPAE